MNSLDKYGAYVRYRFEGKGVCKKCARSGLDLVVPWRGRPGGAGPQVIGMEPVRWSPMDMLLVARHLHRIEEYTTDGASPSGFCEGSLEVPAPVATHTQPHARK